SLGRPGSPIALDAPFEIYQERLAALQHEVENASALRTQMERGRDALERELVLARLQLSPDPADTLLVRAVAALSSHWSDQARDATAENMRLASAADQVASRLREVRQSVDPASSATTLDDIDAIARSITHQRRMLRTVPNSPNMERFVGLI